MVLLVRTLQPSGQMLNTALLITSGNRLEQLEVNSSSRILAAIIGHNLARPQLQTGTLIDLASSKTFCEAPIRLPAISKSTIAPC